MESICKTGTSAVARKGRGQPLERQEKEAMEEKGAKGCTEAAPVPRNTYTCFPRLFSPSLLRTGSTQGPFAGPHLE